MPESLHRLIYTSRNMIGGAAGGAEPEIRQILASARRNNPRVGVTGALMFNGGCFAQVLEGPRAAVEQVFERIQRDHRHSEVSVLQIAGVERRGFPGWSMAFVGRAAEGADTFGHVAEESGFEPALLDGDRLFGILRDLVLEEEGATGVR